MIFPRSCDLAFDPHGNGAVCVKRRNLLVNSENISVHGTAYKPPVSLVSITVRENLAL